MTEEKVLADSRTQDIPEDITKMDIRLGGALVSMNAFKHNNSASRVTMDASHISQAVVLENAERMNISTGMDYNYADYLFDIRIKGDPDQVVRVLKVFKKYQRIGGLYNIETNPILYVVYENLDTGEIDVSIVPTYYFQHSTFGFKYRFTEEMKRIREGDTLLTGTLLAHSAGLDTDNQVYQFGINALVLMGSFPEVIEDGIVVSESFAKRMTTRRFGTLTVNFGQEDYLLNLYGDNNEYKCFPDIGEHIRPDGLVFATRKIDVDLAPVQMTPHALQEVDYIFDKTYYGLPNARVEDITIVHSHDPSTYYIPTGMRDQLEKYYRNHTKFYRDIEDWYYKTKAKKGKTLRLSPELHHVITMGMKQDHNKLKRSNRMTYRKEDIKQYRLTITYSYEMEIELGNKLSDIHGGKGVCVKRIPDELMPKTRDGQVFDIIAPSGSSLNRMNLGRVWEHAMNNLLDEQRFIIKDTLNRQGIETAFADLLNLYQVVSPAYHQIISEGITSKREKENHLHEFIRNEISIFLPYGSVETGSAHMKSLIDQYPLQYDHIWLYEPDGTKVLSKEKFLSGRQYFMRLEKIGENWASTSVPKRQHHGIISKLSSDTKSELPYRNQAIRFGETEFRAMMTACSPAFASSLLTIANNSNLCRQAIRSILEADKPTALKEMVDYRTLPEYQSIAVERICHMMNCFGLEFYYEDERLYSHEDVTPLNIDVSEFEYNNAED